MRLAIEHLTEYRYDGAPNTSIQYVRLTPRADAVQRVLSWKVEAPGRLTPWTDGFGNAVHTVVQDADHHHLPILASGEVETFETHGVLPHVPGGLPPEAFLRATPRTQPDAGVRDLAARLAHDDLLSGLHALTSGIHALVAYDQDQTHVATTAAETLVKGAGVCQDQAHLFIACCLAWGVPARYVSGYLLVPAGDGRHLATHAWAEAFVPGLGWVSFDPSNCQSATEAYVRLAVAFDYEGAAPVRGLRQGGGAEDMRVAVRVKDMAEPERGGEAQ
ncbi:MAG: transglutaminase family protein [Magnetospirillum sp. WYHS-4]